MDPNIPATPKSYPLTSLDQLENRSYFSSFHFQFNKSFVPLPTSKLPSSHEMRPRLLVCHDMKGGYQDDQWVQGDSNCDAYSLWHWYLIDIFVYFSHNLVTLPPPCWTNAAHKHGVQVLGTFITEWKEGAAICKQLLASEESCQMYASRLAELAVVLGFDGWLINIENEVEQAQLSNLKEFIKHLTVSMHQSVPGSLVIWYDSVAKDGELQWQDCLNEANKVFFDLCDGIFTNYAWKANYPEMCAITAGERRFDVYMGIDVFGRNTFGGGGFESNVALKAAKEGGVSAALFAPGWVYETKQGPNFQAAQNRWWGLVADCWAAAQCYPLQIPFFSNFDQGYGKGMYIDGECVSTKPWSNISCQNLQPLLNVVAGSIQDCLEAIVSYQDFVYSGGSCVKLFGKLGDDSHCLTILYNGDLAMGHIPLFVSYSVKVSANAGFSLLIKVHDQHGARLIFLVDSEKSIDPSSMHSSSVEFQVPTSTCVGGSQGQDWNIREYVIGVTDGTVRGIYAVSFLHELNYLRIIDLLSSDNVKIMIEETFGRTLETGSGGVVSTRVPYEAFLGHLRVTFSDSHNFQPLAFESDKVSWSSDSTGQREVSILLRWSSSGAKNLKVARYNLYVRKEFHEDADSTNDKIEYLGVAHEEAFYVSKLEVPQGCKTVSFWLQECCVGGFSQNLKNADHLTIQVPII